MFQPRSSYFRALLVLLAPATVYAALTTGEPKIEDKGAFFSPSALTQGNKIVREIYEQTRPHKEVVVETFATLPPGAGSAEDAAKRIFRERDVDGLVIVAVKQPGSLRVAVGRQTQTRFTATERDQLVESMLAQFRNKNFDAGLLDGLDFARQKLTAAFPAAAGTREDAPATNLAEREPPQVAAPGLPMWAWVLLILGGVWIIRALFRAGSQSSPQGGAGYSNPASSYGSGGWGRSILGGLFGAMAGSWLYDQFARGGDEAYGARHEPWGGDPGSAARDEGEIGSVGGGDFSDTNDSGFDDGGDFGGGGDMGGGDF